MVFPSAYEVEIQRFANALYNLQVGSTTMSQVQSDIATLGGVDATLNYYFNYINGSQSNAQVAETLLANFGLVAGQNGLTDVTVGYARDYIVGALAAVPADQRGAAVADIAAAFASLASDATYGAAATAWNAEVTAAIAYTGAEDTVAGDVVDFFRLTAERDIISGTAGADVFDADVIQVGGPQVNTLATGDILNGGAGLDTLDAQVTNGLYMGSGNMPIQPQTAGIEDIKLEALFSNIPGVNGFSNGFGASPVFVNAKDMAGVDFIGSDHSDADLIIQDLTIDSNEVTSSMTVGMAYTGNADHMWDASDLAVYFDEDYLIPDGPTQIGNSVFYAMLDQINFNIDQPLEDFKLIQVAFTLNGVDKFIDVVGADLARVAAVNTFVGQYAEMVAVLNEKLAALAATDPSLAEVEFQLTDSQFFADPFDGTWGYWIELTNKAGFSNTLLDAEISVDDSSPLRNIYWAVDNTLPTTEENLITVQVELEKVGRGGDGGELVIGGMNKGADNIWGEGSSLKPAGVEQFNVTVFGGELLPSSLAALESTNNALQVVNIDSAAGVTAADAADLIIGNSNTAGTLGTLAGNAQALKDVQILDASGFVGDLTVYAALTDEIGPKYLNRQDTQFDPADDNVEFVYTLGQGNDYLNLVLSAGNFDATGTTTREDFELTINGGTGNDTIRTMIGDGTGVDATQWYINSHLNNTNPTPDVDPQEYLNINAGDGDDTVWTYGAGDFVINAGAGNDTVYTENSGAKAQWRILPIDATPDNMVSNPNWEYIGLLTDGADLDLMFDLTLTVTFKGLVSSVTVTLPTNSFTQLEMMQLVKDAINNDDILSKLLVANDGPANTLIIDALIDGDMTGDLNIALSSEAGSFANALQQLVITGADGGAASDNQVTLGLGDDIAVLGTAAAAGVVEDNDNLIYDAVNSGNDVIVNFVAADASALALPGNDTFDFTALTGAAATFVDTAWSNIDGSVTVVVETIANDTAAEIKALFDATLQEDLVVSEHIYIAVDGNNVGSAYLIQDGPALFDSVVTLIGNIDLADTDWFALDQVNFV